MYVEMIKQLNPVNIRQTCNMVIGLNVVKDEHKVDINDKEQRLVSVDVAVELAVDPDVGKLVRVPLPNELPIEWSPSMRQRFSRDALQNIDRSSTWLARTPVPVINRHLNRGGFITITGIRTPGKYEPLDQLRIEVVAQIYHSVAYVEVPHPLLKLIEVSIKARK